MLVLSSNPTCIPENVDVARPFLALYLLPIVRCCPPPEISVTIDVAAYVLSQARFAPQDEIDEQARKKIRRFRDVYHSELMTSG